MSQKIKEEWYKDLAILHEKSRVFKKRPRLFFGPIPQKMYGHALTFFNIIVISQKAKNYPHEARLYLLAHEYGHIYCHHYYTRLTMILFIWITFYCAIVPNLKIFYLLFWAFIYYGYKIIDQAEDQADSFGALLIGPETMHSGCSWIAKETNTLSKRKKRLDRFKEMIQ